MSTPKKFEPNPIVDPIAMIIARLYKTYYDLNQDLTPIHELNGDYEKVRLDTRYEVPIICSLWLQILFEHDRREEWARMLDSLYRVSVDAGASEYLSAFSMADMFEVKWDEKETDGKKIYLPRIEFVTDPEKFIAPMSA